MFESNEIKRITTWMAPLILLIGGVPTYQASAVDAAESAQMGTPLSQNFVKGIPDEQFAQLQSLIKPKPGGFAEVPWMTSLWEARKKAAAKGKPILIWVGDGHPLGFT